VGGIGNSGGARYRRYVQRFCAQGLGPNPHRPWRMAATVQLNRHPRMFSRRSPLLATQPWQLFLISLQTFSLFGWPVADVWCWFVLREEYCWLVAGGWFGLRAKYCWLVADKPSEQGACGLLCRARARSAQGPHLTSTLPHATSEPD
jgi:hypothetical protein